MADRQETEKQAMLLRNVAGSVGDPRSHSWCPWKCSNSNGIGNNNCYVLVTFLNVTIVHFSLHSGPVRWISGEGSGALGGTLQDHTSVRAKTELEQT